MTGRRGGGGGGKGGEVEGLRAISLLTNMRVLKLNESGCCTTLGWVAREAVGGGEGDLA